MVVERHSERNILTRAPTSAGCLDSDSDGTISTAEAADCLAVLTVKLLVVSWVVDIKNRKHGDGKESTVIVSPGTVDIGLEHVHDVGRSVAECGRKALEIRHVKAEGELVEAGRDHAVTATAGRAPDTLLEVDKLSALVEVDSAGLAITLTVSVVFSLIPLCLGNADKVDPDTTSLLGADKVKDDITSNHVIARIECSLVLEGVDCEKTRLWFHFGRK